MIKNIDLVVVNYQTPGDLFDFCCSYEDHKPEIRSRLIIMNNDPTEADIAVASEFVERGTVHRVVNGENIGYSGALNLAYRHFVNDAMAFFNADTQLTAGVVDSCCDLLQDERVGVVGPGQVNRAGQVTHAGIFGTHDRPQHRGWKDRWKPEYEDVREAISVSGSAYFTTRKCMNDLFYSRPYKELYPDVVGPFLPTPHYYEETWFSYHAWHLGYRVMYNGQARMLHEWHKASPHGGYAEQMMPQSRRMFREACDHLGIPHD